MPIFLINAYRFIPPIIIDTTDWLGDTPIAGILEPTRNWFYDKHITGHVRELRSDLASAGIIPITNGRYYIPYASGGTDEFRRDLPVSNTISIINTWTRYVYTTGGTDEFRRDWDNVAGLYKGLENL